MADYAGAVAAIKQKFLQEWDSTPVVFQNENTYDPGAKPDEPWAYLEVIGASSSLRAAGRPGSNIWLYVGTIFVHVFVPLNSGDVKAQSLAVAAGEIFRAKAFYEDGNGAVVRTWSPRTDGGASQAEDGNWFRVTCAIPFEYYHVG